MSDPSKASLPAGETEPDISPEQLEAIRAAMMEELGNARRDTLPLEDKRGPRAQVDLQALDRTKKSNDHRTLEFQITQTNANAHNAWKTAVYDVHPADRGLDDMDCGQAHRQGLVARLAGMGPRSKGRGNSNQARRGDMSIRGGYSAPRRGSSATPRLTSGPNDGRAAGFVDGPIKSQAIPRGKTTSDRPGSARGGTYGSAKKIGVPFTEKPNLSLDDSRSSNNNPSTSITPSTARTLPKTSSFTLATPEEFLQQSWSPQWNQTKSVKEHNSPQSLLSPHDQNTSLDATRTTSTGTRIQHQNSEMPSSGGPSETNGTIMQQFPVHARTSHGKLTVDLGFGELRTVMNTSRGQSIYILTFEAQGKLHLEQPLGDSFGYTIDGTTLSFVSTSLGQSCTWKVKPREDWMIINLKMAIDQCKTQAARPMPALEAGLSSADSTRSPEALICFSDDENGSSWLQDLICLMDEKTGEEVTQPVGNEMAQPLTIHLSDAFEVPNPPEEHTKPKISKSALFRGLATSKYAAAEMIDKFLDENPPQLGNPAADKRFGDEMKRRVSASSKFSATTENTNNVNRLTCIGEEGCIQKQGLTVKYSDPSEKSLVHEQTPVQQQPHPNNSPRVQYTIDDMMKCRANACVIHKPLMAQWIAQPQRGRLHVAGNISAPGVSSPKISSNVAKVPARDAINTTRQRIPIVAEVETPNLLKGLASSIYAASSPPKLDWSSSKISNSQSAFAEAGENSNSDNKPGIKNTGRQIPKIKELPKLTTTLQSVEAELCAMCPPTAGGHVLTIASLAPTKSTDQDKYRKAETQAQQGHCLAVENLNKLRHRDSFTSLASKDSDVTVKASGMGLDSGKLPQPHETTFHGHSSHSSLDSTTSTASFATASEEKIHQQDEPTNQITTGLQALDLGRSVTGAETSQNTPFEFPPGQIVELSKATAIKKPHADDMFDQINSSTHTTPTSASSFPKSPKALQLAKNPITSSLLKTKGGLASSRFARSASTSSLPLSNIENRSQLQPFEINFTRMDQAALGNYGPYVPVSSFPAPPITLPVRADPLVATVITNDPMNPGRLIEVTGHLKGSPFFTPVPVLTSQFPVYPGLVNQNHRPEFVTNGPISPPSPVATRTRTPLTPKREINNDSTAQVQQEIQLRLHRSLAVARSPK